MQVWNLACPDWEVKLRAGRLPIANLPLTAHGDRAVAVYDKLKLADVTGTPALADASGAWFREIVRVMFGAYDPVTRQRYIRELFALVPKKNSKTTYGALGLMLVALLLNQRPRAPFLMTAPVQDVADLAFSAVSGAIALDPVLESKLHVRDHLKEIVHRETKAKLEIITFDPKAVTGKKVVGALIDEVHVLGKMARADKALLQLRGGMGPYPEAFLAMVSTQSDEAPAGVFKDELQRARDVRDGRRQAGVLPVLYEMPERMQRDPAKPWRDPANWPMITPNLGRSVHMSTLVEEFRDEETKGEDKLRTWASQHLNIEIGVALMSDSWAGAEFWAAAGDKALTFEELLRRSEVIVAGIDGGGLDDLLGLALLGREKTTRRWLHWSHAWAHKIVLERRKEVAPRLLDFEKQGDLTIVDLPGDDITDLADLLVKVRDAQLLPEKDAIAVDRAGIDAIRNELKSPGRKFTDDEMVAIPQGWQLNGSIKTVERMVAGGEFIHGAQPLMAWCVGNAKVVPVGNAIRIDKQVSGTAKIDPLVATFCAAALLALNPKARARKYQFFVAG